MLNCVLELAFHSSRPNEEAALQSDTEPWNVENFTGLCWGYSVWVIVMLISIGSFDGCLDSENTHWATVLHANTTVDRSGCALCKINSNIPPTFNYKTPSSHSRAAVPWAGKIASVFSSSTSLRPLEAGAILGWKVLVSAAGWRRASSRREVLACQVWHFIYDALKSIQ